jgi:Zn-dependent protease
LERTRCKVCGAPLDPLTGHRCRYCGELVCINHLLPELHGCMGLRRGLSVEETMLKPMEVEAFKPRVKPRLPVSRGELRDMAASTLVLAFAFTILSNRFQLLINPAALLLDLPVMLLAVATAFLLHELAHRFTARRMGYWAEYRSWTPGLLLALATSFLGFLFAAPGAVYVGGVVRRRDYGVIALAGPLTNVLAAFTFKLLTPLGSVSMVNAWLSVFNLLPLPPLDGYKVAAWSPFIWLGAMAAALASLLL